MLYIVIGGLTAVAMSGWIFLSRQRRRRHEAHLARRAERQRKRIVEWNVLQWLYGRRANLRITDQRKARDRAGR